MFLNEDRLIKLLERIAVATEKMGADPDIEIHSGPPLCPTCGEENPTVALPSQEGGRGPLGEVMIECNCVSCGAAIFVVIESFSCHRRREDAVAELTLTLQKGNDSA
ncbi:MAG TPA: hypothetical protein VJQ25_08675 [Nitrospira sp.]|nr:hypothetical protein [Nitrospira sp.]